MPFRNWNKRTRDWITGSLAAELPGGSEARRRTKLATLFVTIVLLAFGVRSLHWLDHRVELDANPGLLKDYRREAHRMFEDGRILFPSSTATVDARMLVHPPGYSILLLLLYGRDLDRNSYGLLELLQILCDSLAAGLVFIIALSVLPTAAAGVAGVLVAFSPHLSYYSFQLSPDSIAILPILLSIALLIRARARPRFYAILAAGAMIGLSCWLRANALLLAPFIAVGIALLFEPGTRLRYSTAFVLAAAVVVLPITIRNMIVFREFVPLSLGAGVTLVEGIADFDEHRRFGMPRDDRETVVQDGEISGKPEYSRSLWSPDGIERDRARFSRGVGVIKSNPVWFAGVMARRAFFMLSYDKPFRTGWPFSTAAVGAVANEPAFGSHFDQATAGEPVESFVAADYVTRFTRLASGANAVLADNGLSVELTGDQSNFGDQLASFPIPIEEQTDYVFIIPINIVRGQAAIKVLDAELRKTLASSVVTPARARAARRRARRSGLPISQVDDGQAPLRPAEIGFASGNRKQVVMAISNDGIPPTLRLGQAKLYRIARTPYPWTSAIRPPVRMIQRVFYRTSRMLPAVIMGIGLLAFGRRKAAIVALIAVPLYYLFFQSVFHTEYRYILAIHYFLFIFAAVTLYCVARAFKFGVRNIVLQRNSNEAVGSAGGAAGSRSK